MVFGLGKKEEAKTFEPESVPAQLPEVAVALQQPEQPQKAFLIEMKVLVKRGDLLRSILNMPADLVKDYGTETIQEFILKEWKE
jgi:hypothetical protein